VVEIFADIFSIKLMLAAVCLFFCAIVQGYSGFGGGLMVVPIMVLLFDPVIGIALAAIPFFVGVLVIVPRAIGQVNWIEVLSLASISSVAILIGQTFLISAESRNLKIAMGIFIICIAILFLRNWKYSGKRNLGTAGLVGAATGGVTGTLGIPGGPIMVMYYLSAPVEPRVQRANILLTGFINTIVFIAGFVFHDVYKQVTVIQSGILAPGFIAGSILGQYLFRVVPAQWFSKATSIMLLVIGLVIIVA